MHAKGEADHEETAQVGGVVVEVDDVASMTSYIELVKKDRLVVFGNDSCPFCSELERTLDERAYTTPEESGAAWSYYRLNRLTYAPHLWDELRLATGQSSVPYVFVEGKLVGGADDIVRDADYIGKMPGLLAPPHFAADKRSPSGFPQPPFLFPSTVDNRQVRAVSIVRFFVAVLAAVVVAVAKTDDEDYTIACWITLAIFVDFCLGSFAGSTASPLGAIGGAAVGISQFFMKTEPAFCTGAPKQFANMVGVVFAGLSSLFLFLAPEYGIACKWIGFSLLVGLMGAIGLNGFLNFCLACVFFALGIQYGIIPKTMYTISIAEKPDIKWTWKDLNKRLNQGVPSSDSMGFPWREEPSKVDLKAKLKTDDQRREAFHLIKYFHAHYWGMPLSLMALSYVFLVAAEYPYITGNPVDSLTPFKLRVSNKVPHALAIISIVVWVAFFFLQVARIAMYPKKVWKEWTCPVRSCFFVFPTITILLLGAGAMVDRGNSDESWRHFAKAMFWISAPLQLIVSMFVLSNWITYLHEWEHVSAVWLAVPVSNVFAAIAWEVIYRKQGAEFLKSGGSLWLGFAMLLFFALYPIIIYKIALGHNQDSRESHWLIIAAPTVVAVGWHAVITYTGEIFTILFIGSLSLLPVFCYGIYPMRFYLSGKWSMSDWVVSFTCCALAAGALQYHSLCGPDAKFSEVMAYIALAVASYANIVNAGFFVNNLFTYKVFTAEKQLAPLMFMKLTHESIRGLVPKVKLALEGASSSTRAAVAFVDLWESLQLVLRVHMVHEDQAIFPAADAWLPHHSDPFAHEHAEDERQEAEIRPILATLKAALEGGDHLGTNQALTMLGSLLPRHLDFVMTHIRHEEDRLSPLLRKNLSIKAMREVITKAWDLTSSDDLFRFLPLVVQHQRRHPDRVAFIKTLLWAMPERCKQVGVMLALGLDVPTWQRLSEALPDIIPRGMCSWRKFG